VLAPQAAALDGAARQPLFSCLTPQGRLLVRDVGGGRVTVAFPKPHLRSLARLGGRPHASRYARKGYSGGGEEQLQVETEAGRLTVYTRTVRTNFAPGEPNDPAFSSGAVFQARNGRVTRRTCRDEASFRTDISLGRPSTRSVVLAD